MGLRKSKKNEAEIVQEGLEATGAEGKYGDQQAKSYLKEQEKLAAEEHARQIEQLQAMRKKHDYIQFLAVKLTERLQYIPWYPGWDYRVAGTEIGVVMEIQSHTGKLFRSAFRVIFDPYYDLNAINNFGERAEELMDRETNIVLPDSPKILKA